MPIHPSVASKFPLLEGISSFAEGLADRKTRARLDEFMSITGAPSPPDADTLDTVAPGPHGPVPVRVYRPTGRGVDRPLLVWRHGGAFMGGDLDMPEADWTARQVCDRAGAAVVSVDYRLAIAGATYPVPHDDVVAAVRWARNRAADLGADPAHIYVGGASAGGNLAGWLPAGLILAYTTTNAVVPRASTTLTRLMADVPRPLRFLPEDRETITRNYLGGPETLADGYAMPANGVLEGLCPVLVLNAEYDDLRPSGEAFTAVCALAGVEVRQVTATGMLHGFLNLPAEAEPVREALDLIAQTVAAPPRRPG